MKIKKIAVFTIIILVSLGAGAFGGFLWAGRAFAHMEIAKEVDLAAQAAMDANTLAMLQLNDTRAAIKSLEMRMDGAVSAFADWDEYVSYKPDEKTRAARDRWLTSVKIYRQNYPFKDDDTNLVAQVNSFLATIPGRSPKSTCKSDLCRLDDLRLAGLTNFVPTNTVSK